MFPSNLLYPLSQSLSPPLSLSLSLSLDFPHCKCYVLLFSLYVLTIVYKGEFSNEAMSLMQDESQMFDLNNAILTCCSMT